MSAEQLRVQLGLVTEVAGLIVWLSIIKVHTVLFKSTASSAGSAVDF